MKSLRVLVKRDCLVFLRDKGAVFFSMLSMVIVLALMVIFLGDMNVRELMSILKTYGGSRDLVQDEENVKNLVRMWTIAGILVTNTVTVTLAVISTMISDMEKKRLAAFYTAPIRKSKTAAAYIISAVLIGTILCMLTFGAAMIYMKSQGTIELSFRDVMMIFVNIVLDSTVFSILMYFAATLVKTSSAWSGLGTIVGTLVGFLGAIYIPVGSLPVQVVNALKFTPVLHSTALMRTLLCRNVLTQTFHHVPEVCVEEVKKGMGIELAVNGTALSQTVEYLIVIGFGLVVFGVTLFRTRRHQGYDR